MPTTTTTAQPITSTTTSKPSKTAPNANAGTHKKIKPGTAITLDGSNSYDADGDPLQYFWRVIEGPDIYILKNKNTASPTFKPFKAGTYEIGLKVFDGTYYSEEATVTITVERKNGSGATTTTAGQYSTTTTSSPPTNTSSSTTTIVNSKVWCPFFFLTNNDSEKIKKLRDFRNNVLLKTPRGKEYVKLFYKNAIELITILTNNQDITNQSKAVLEELLPKIKLILEGQSISISPILLYKTEGILDQISREASVELKTAIEKLKKDLEEEKIFDELGMRVNSQH